MNDENFWSHNYIIEITLLKFVIVIHSKSETQYGI